jgi:peptidoglycan/LPS O-acetylase OafA/YrhL
MFGDAMSGSSKTKAPDHLGFLDGIRGGAALWVLLAHCMIWGGWYGVPLPSPKIAVDIFMVASGFLMVYQYRRREAREPMDSRRTAIRFWIRRFFRIAPIYYLCLLILLVFWSAYSNGLATLQQVLPERWANLPIYVPANYHVGWLNTLMHATFLFGMVPKYAASNMSPDWSIGLEMQFYAVFPALYLLFRRISWVGVLAVVILLSEGCNRWFAHLPGPVPGTYGLFAEPTFLLMKLPVFLIGMLVGETFCRARVALVSSVLMSITAMLVTAHYSIWVSVVTGMILWLTWSGAGAGDHGHPIVYRWLTGLLSNRCAAFMADASYSVYLLHCFFISFVGGFLFRQPDFVALSAPLRVAVLAIIICPAVYLAAWLLHRVLEKPGIELGKRVINRWFPPVPVRAANDLITAAPSGAPVSISPVVLREGSNQ